MKKLFVFLCSFFLLFTFLVLPAGAETTNQQPLYTNDPSWPKLQTYLQSGDEVISALYYTAGWNLGDADNLSEAIAERTVKMYIIKTAASKIHYAHLNKDGTFSLTTIPPYHSAAAYNQALPSPAETVLQPLGSDTTVHTMYALDISVNIHDVAEWNWDALYFQTNKGEFVYAYHRSNQKAYLFPAKAFLEYWAWWDDGFASEWDLSVYELGSPNFNLNAPLPGALIIPAYVWFSVLVAVIALILIIRHYSNKRVIRKMIQEQQAAQA